jgi:5-methyltetrahydrofolate--homocysteine methyltransferase
VTTPRDTARRAERWTELRERLRSGPVLLLDGGLGSSLIARGLPPGMAPDRWNLERPEAIAAVHGAFVEAGSDVVHANTFGGNRTRLARAGLAGRLAEVNEAAVNLARASGARFVLADLGPTGEYLPPVGGGDAQAWAAVFREQVRVLLDTDLDGFHLETVSDLREATIALAAVRELAPDSPCLASLTFERRKRGFFTIMGDPLVPALQALARAGADAVGANCTLGSADFVLLAEDALRAGAPLVLQPNAGQPEVGGGQVTYRQDPEAFGADMAAILALSPGPGGRIASLGGCCGCDARFIAALRARIRKAGQP